VLSCAHHDLSFTLWSASKETNWNHLLKTLNCGTGKWKMAFSSLKHWHKDKWRREDKYSQSHFFTEIPTHWELFLWSRSRKLWLDWGSFQCSHRREHPRYYQRGMKYSHGDNDTSCKVIWATTLSGTYVPMFRGTYCHHLQDWRPQYHSSAVKTPNLTQLQSNIFVMSETHSQYAH
jgi:hypothetical protein